MARTSVNYRKLWEDHHKASVLPGMHIHHRDGNSHNNDISNLMIVTPQEHEYLHELMGHKRIGNFIKKAANQTGIACSESKKMNISRSLKGKVLSKDQKLKISKSLGGTKPFLVFHKMSGEFIGKFETKASCSTILNIPANKLRKCLLKIRHSIGNYYFIEETEYNPQLNIPDLYKNDIKSGLIKMANSQRKRLQCLQSQNKY